MKIKLLSLILISKFFMAISADEATTSKALPELNTKSTIGNVNGLNIEVIVQSPSAQETALQVICLFEYRKMMSLLLHLPYLKN